MNEVDLPNYVTNFLDANSKVLRFFKNTIVLQVQKNSCPNQQYYFIKLNHLIFFLQVQNLGYKLTQLQSIMKSIVILTALLFCVLADRRLFELKDTTVEPVKTQVRGLIPVQKTSTEALPEKKTAKLDEEFQPSHRQVVEVPEVEIAQTPVPKPVDLPQEIVPEVPVIIVDPVQEQTPIVVPTPEVPVVVEPKEEFHEKKEEHHKKEHNKHHGHGERKHNEDMHHRPEHEQRQKDHQRMGPEHHRQMDQQRRGPEHHRQEDSQRPEHHRQDNQRPEHHRQDNQLRGPEHQKQEGNQLRGPEHQRQVNRPMPQFPQSAQVQVEESNPTKPSYLGDTPITAQTQEQSPYLENDYESGINEDVFSMDFSFDAFLSSFIPLVLLGVVVSLCMKRCIRIKRRNMLLRQQQLSQVSQQNSMVQPAYPQPQIQYVQYPMPQQQYYHEYNMRPQQMRAPIPTGQPVYQPYV